MRYPPELLKELRVQGFKRTYSSKGGGDPMVIYTKTVRQGKDTRKLDVQLWSSGYRRVSHMLNGRGSTHPTLFTTLDEMKAAIEHETTRTDQKALWQT